MGKSDANVELVQRVFAAFNGRDLEALLLLVDSDVEFYPATRMIANGGRPYRGHSGMRRYLRDVAEIWKQLETTPRSFRSEGDHVAAYGRVRGHIAGGTVVDSPADWILQIRDGKIVWGCVYAKQDEARRAIGEPAAEVEALMGAG